MLQASVGVDRLFCRKSAVFILFFMCFFVYYLSEILNWSLSKYYEYTIKKNNN